MYHFVTEERIMRQTSKRARRSRLLMIFILVLLIALVLWGLAALADRLPPHGAAAQR